MERTTNVIWLLHTYIVWNSRNTLYLGYEISTVYTKSLQNLWHIWNIWSVYKLLWHLQHLQYLPEFPGFADVNIYLYIRLSLRLIILIKIHIITYRLHVWRLWRPLQHPTSQRVWDDASWVSVVVPSSLLLCTNSSTCQCQWPSAQVLRVLLPV